MGKCSSVYFSDVRVRRATRIVITDTAARALTVKIMSSRVDARDDDFDGTSPAAFLGARSTSEDITERFSTHLYDGERVNRSDAFTFAPRASSHDQSEPTVDNGTQLAVATNVVAARHTRSTDLRLKALHAVNQKRLIAETLGWRTQLQTMLHLGNRLPYSGLLPAPNARFGHRDLGRQCPADAVGAVASLQDFLRSAQLRASTARTNSKKEECGSVAAQYTTVGEEMRGLLRDLTGLGLSRIERAAKCGPGSVPHSRRDAAPTISSEDTSELIWPEIAAMWNRTSPYIVATIDKWARKVRLSTAARKRKFRALDQSVEVQVEAVMANRDRVMRRTRIMRCQRSTCLGVADSQMADRRLITAGSTGEDSMVLGCTKAPVEDDERFDDNDFYPKLIAQSAHMRETGRVSRGIAGSRAMKQYPSRKREGLDTRASKGRRLQLSVHTKLVNFVAPIPAPGTSMDTSELYSSLFGLARSVAYK